MTLDGDQASLVSALCSSSGGGRAGGFICDDSERPYASPSGSTESASCIEGCRSNGSMDLDGDQASLALCSNRGGGGGGGGGGGFTCDGNEGHLSMSVCSQARIRPGWLRRNSHVIYFGVAAALLSVPFLIVRQASGRR